MENEDYMEFEDFFWIPYNVYQSMGIDFKRRPKPLWRQLLHSGYLAFAISSHLFCDFHLFAEMGPLLRDSDFLMLIRIFAFVAYAVDADIKFVAFQSQQQKIRHIYQTLQECYPKSKMEKLGYNIKKHYLTKAMRRLIAFYYISVGILATCPVLQSAFTYVGDVRKFGANYTEFAYLKMFPTNMIFDFHQPWRYFWVYLMEMVDYHYLIVCNVGTDLWLICFTAQICMHLDFIGKELRKYKPKQANVKEDCEFLAQLIKTHRTMMK